MTEYRRPGVDNPALFFRGLTIGLALSIIGFWLPLAGLIWMVAR